MKSIYILSLFFISNSFCQTSEEYEIINRTFREFMIEKIISQNSLIEPHEIENEYKTSEYVNYIKSTIELNNDTYIAICEKNWKNKNYIFLVVSTKSNYCGFDYGIICKLSNDNTISFFDNKVICKSLDKNDYSLNSGFFLTDELIVEIINNDINSFIIGGKEIKVSYKNNETIPLLLRFSLESK
jgi:S-methylmethionine-dependent homocysteine/selenocysteine methylase